MSELKDQIEDYHKGKLTPAQMHALEKKALSDSFLADALEGAGSVGPDDFADDIGELKSRMEGKKSIILSWRIAAGVIIVAAGLALVFIPFNTSEELTAQQRPLEEKSASPAGDSSNAENLLSLEKQDAQPKPDATSAERQPSVTPPPVRDNTAGDKPAGPVAGLETEEAKDQLAGLSEKEADVQEEVADEKAKGADGFFAIRADSTTLTVTAADDDLQKKSEPKKAEAAEGAAQRSRATQSAAPLVSSRTVKGKVTIADDGLPIPGVNVVVKGTTVGAVTDIDGNYSIELPADRSQLQFSFIGLHPQEVRVTNDNVIDVKMTEDVSQLSEVVVTGYAPLDNTGEPVIKLAEPIGGRKAYDKYLEDELRYPQEAMNNNIKGRVTVQFTVDTRGIIGDFEVIKKLGYGCDEEVIRLVKEGPKWLPTTQDAVPIESIVRVRMKFDPKKKKK